jgi:hypothetical protein
MQEMIKQEDGTWASTSRMPPVEVKADLPDNIEIVNQVTANEEVKPKRKTREKKAKP